VGEVRTKPKFPVLEKDAESFKEIMKREAPDIEVIDLDPGQECVF